jgi:hypothetical protein
MLRRVVSYRLTDVSEMLIASGDSQLHTHRNDNLESHITVLSYPFLSDTDIVIKWITNKGDTKSSL